MPLVLVVAAATTPFFPLLLEVAVAPRLAFRTPFALAAANFLPPRGGPVLVVIAPSVWRRLRVVGALKPIGLLSERGKFEAG